MMFQPQGEILPEDVSDEDRERILKRVASEIVSRRLTAPAIFFLESCSPLSFVGSQGMIALEPFIQAIFDLPDYRRFALMMERRENVNRLITMIEAINYEQKTAKKKEQESPKRRWLWRKKE